MSIKKDFHFDETLYKKFDDIIKDYYTQFVKIHISLNFQAKNYLKVLKSFKAKPDEELLLEIKKRWKNHQDLLHLLINLFSYIVKNIKIPPFEWNYNRTGRMWCIIAWKTSKARESKLFGSSSSMNREWERFSFSWKNWKKFEIFRFFGIFSIFHFF